MLECRTEVPWYVKTYLVLDLSLEYNDINDNDSNNLPNGDNNHIPV